MFGDRTGVSMGSERMHTLTNQVAEGLTVLDVAPSREEIAPRIAEVAAGKWCRPMVVLGIDGAWVPTRPERRSREPAVLGPLWIRWHPRKRITKYIGTGELISLD